MKKNYGLFLTIAILMFSCGSDDSVTPLEIETNPDAATLAQNSEIEIFIFSNDLNIPSTGQLTVSAPSKGNAVITDVNNTPNSLNDDVITYTANANVTGSDSFEYTICNSSGSCKTELVTVNITNNSSIAFDLENMPYQTLSEYQFFSGALKDLEPETGVTPYTLNSTLFTDYAKKKRFIWMPSNTKANYISDDVPLNFPVGTILIKNFYYDNVLPNNETKIIETRLMIRKSDGWIFAEYVWNTEQTEATLDMNGSFVDIEWQNGPDVTSIEYRIPAGPECHTCHKVSEISQPVGTKPRNLNRMYNYNDGAANQLEKLVDLGYLDNSLPNNISVMPDYNDTSESLDSRARAYLDINCAHCHSDETHCAYRPMRLDFSDTEDYTNIGVCVEPDTDLGLNLGDIVVPGDPRNSVLHFRLNSTEPSNRMPLLGRTITHTEGVELIEAWINSVNSNCN